MDVLGADWVYFIGTAAITLGVALIITVFLGALTVILFLRTRKVFIPTATLLILNFFETPIKEVLWILGIEGVFLDNMLTSLRNTLYKKSYSNTPYETRAIFLPQCLRHPECPAKLTAEGIACINCGRCGIGELKKFSEELGYLFFVVPGSSFVKRMIKKYRPQAVLGVGCSMEVKEGTSLVSAIGIPVQSVMLTQDGCINTRVNVMALMEKIVADNKREFTGRDKMLAEKISEMWDQGVCV
ncbi:MAG: DUF116 domain-containing protein, partial [Candidatus Altiarchaeota archaeon]